jgi:polygalacturonase
LNPNSSGSPERFASRESKEAILKVRLRSFPSTVAAVAILSALWLARSGPVQAASPGGRIFNILDYGAKNDASTLATKAFQQAIAAARNSGGGTIYVPAGRYISGPIELFSNMTLRLDVGATITFPVAPLPLVPGRYLGVNALVPMPLVGGHDVDNVAVTGRGVLVTGDFAAWGHAYGPPVAAQSGNANGPLWQHLLDALDAGRPVARDEYRAAARELRPSFICFMNAKNVLVQGVRIVGGPAFVVHLLYSENAAVRNVIIQAYPGAHANGIVVDSSRFVRISNDYIDTGDDGIAIKSGKDADGLRVNRPSEDVTITNCTVHRAHGAVVIGSETSGSIRNIVADNITADGTENGIRIKSRRGRGGVVEDVRFDNWTMEKVGTGIILTSYYQMGVEGATVGQPVSNRTPVFRDISISNVTIDDGRKAAIDIEGLPEMPIDGLNLTNILASGERGLIASNTSALELHNIEVNALHGPDIAIDNSSNLVLDDATSSEPLPNSPVIRLTRTPGAILENSRAFPGTGVFLATGFETAHNVHLSNNSLSNARIPMQTDSK